MDCLLLSLKMAWRMPGRTIIILEIKKILQNNLRGTSDRQAARAAGVSRTTLLGYLDCLQSSGLDLQRCYIGSLWVASLCLSRTDEYRFKHFESQEDLVDF